MTDQSNPPGTLGAVPVTPPPPPVNFLKAPLPHIGAWTHYFLKAEVPVLASTALALEELRTKEDEVDANMLTAVIQADPLMTLKVLSFAAGLRKPSQATETESITSSLVLMGISPFFRNFAPQRTVEDWLTDQPDAKEGLQRLLRRAERAGQFALGFAVHRGDTDAPIIHQAAFLHDFAEMLLWLHAPALAIQIRDAQATDSTLRSSVIQRDVLGVELTDLRQALMKLWRLPELLISISDDRHAERSNVQCVVLAVRLARHTAVDWDNAAIPDDIDDIARLLNTTPRIARLYLNKIDHPMLEAASLLAPHMPDQSGTPPQAEAHG
jgi:HD-like signal output (HDOD) protein